VPAALTPLWSMLALAATSAHSLLRARFAGNSFPFPRPLRPTSRSPPRSSTDSVSSLTALTSSEFPTTSLDSHDGAGHASARLSKTSDKQLLTPLTPPMIRFAIRKRAARAYGSPPHPLSASLQRRMWSRRDLYFDLGPEDADVPARILPLADDTPRALLPWRVPCVYCVGPAVVLLKPYVSNADLRRFPRATRPKSLLPALHPFLLVLPTLALSVLVLRAACTFVHLLCLRGHHRERDLGPQRNIRLSSVLILSCLALQTCSALCGTPVRPIDTALKLRPAESSLVLESTVLVFTAYVGDAAPPLRAALSFSIIPQRS
jgi:hypothetical protein